MKNENVRSLSEGVRVTTAAQLMRVQQAFVVAASLLMRDEKRGNRLVNACQTVLSALTLVLRYETAVLPQSVRPALELIKRELS